MALANHVIDARHHLRDRSGRRLLQFRVKRRIDAQHAAACGGVAKPLLNLVVDQVYKVGSFAGVYVLGGEADRL